MFVRTDYRHDHMFITVFFSSLLGAGIISFLGNYFAIGSNPWYSPREFIPTFGMVLGNVSIKRLIF
jgi:ABC-type iron transport system FetAB permease component